MYYPIPTRFRIRKGFLYTVAGSCHSISFRDTASRHPAVAGAGRLFLPRGGPDGHEKLIPCHPAVYIICDFCLWWGLKLDKNKHVWYNGRIGVLTLSTCTEVKGMTNVISVGIWAVIFVLYYRAVKMVKDRGRKALGAIMLIICVMEIAMSVVWFFSKNQRLLVSPFTLLLDGVLLLMAIRNYNLVKESSN